MENKELSLKHLLEILATIGTIVGFLNLENPDPVNVNFTTLIEGKTKTCISDIYHDLKDEQRINDSLIYVIESLKFLYNDCNEKDKNNNIRLYFNTNSTDKSSLIPIINKSKLKLYEDKFYEELDKLYADFHKNNPKDSEDTKDSKDDFKNNNIKHVNLLNFESWQYYLIFRHIGITEDLAIESISYKTIEKDKSVQYLIFDGNNINNYIEQAIVIDCGETKHKLVISGDFRTAQKFDIDIATVRDMTEYNNSNYLHLVKHQTILLDIEQAKSYNILI